MAREWMTACRVAAVLALGLAAGVAVARDLPPIKTIGIVSDVGDKVTYKHIGFMVFSNAEAETAFPDWQIDAFITGEVQAALKDRFEIRGVTFAKGSIAPSLEPKLFGDPSPEDTLPANAKPADGAPIDAYLVVWPISHDVYPTNQYVHGLGLLTQGSRALLYAKLAFTLVDGHTFKEIDDCWLKVPGKSTDDNEMRLREDLKVESFDQMTPEQKQGFEQGMKGLIHDGLTYCLHDLKLTP
jgi:hypothetical protein